MRTAFSAVSDMAVSMLLPFCAMCLCDAPLLAGIIESKCPSTPGNTEDAFCPTFPNIQPRFNASDENRQHIISLAHEFALII